MQFRRSIPFMSLFFISIFLFPKPLSAQISRADQIDNLIKPFSERGYFSGVVVAAKDGKVMYEKGFGNANAEFGIRNQPDTRIGIASITKPMTTVILTRLIQARMIALEDTVSKYIPGFPHGDKITIGMLANHRSGIPHRVMPQAMEAVHHSSEEMVEEIAKAKLEFEPGSKRLYSSAGYALLAHVLEVASGRKYAELLQQYVFDPAGMKDSVEFDSEAIMKRKAQDYLLRPGGPINASLKDYSFLVGAGSVFCTAMDVYRFGEALLEGKYGSQARNELVENDAFSASGRTNGHRAYVEIDKKNKYGFVVLANLSSGAFDVVMQGISEILQGKELTVKNFSFPNLITLSEKDLREFAGSYPRTDGGEFVFVLKDGVLYSGDLAIYPTGNNCFFDYSFFGEVCFSRDGANKVKSVVWKGLNFELKGEKK